MENQSQQVPPILITAWTRYAQLNDMSLKRSKAYQQMRRWIIVMGILATMFAILTETYPASFSVVGSLILKVLLIASPIIGSILASITGKKFSNGDWLISRAGAEEIQKEISVLSACDSEYITRYHGSFLVDTKLWIVMDYGK